MLRWEHLKTLILGVIICIATFPENNWAYATGIDPPLLWVFNHFFEHGLSEGRHIIFPHGPLAFVMYPLPENAPLSLLVLCALKILLVFNIKHLAEAYPEKSKWLIALTASYVISLLAGLNHLLLAGIILLYCNSYKSSNPGHRYVAYLLSAFAIFIKAYIGILSIVLFISFIGYTSITRKSWRILLTDTAIFAGFTFALWLIMYGTAIGLPGYFIGLVQLGRDNSSAVSYYPYNNWLLLLAFMAVLPVIAILNRNRKLAFFAILTGVSLFAAWKHGMARQDIYHVKGFIVYFAILCIIYVIFNKDKIIINVVILLLSTLFFLDNMKSSVNYYEPETEMFTASNFLDLILKYDSLKTHSESQTARDISSNTLPQSFKRAIGRSTVDVYPWDYSIISANGLNWRPRVVIHSYAAYTSWLDTQNARHFNSEMAPEYVIWELQKLSTDVNGGEYNSIDNRYLLNDEPNTLLELIRHYEYHLSNDRFLLVKRRNAPLQKQLSMLYRESLGWSEWTKAPVPENGQVTRIKMQFEKTALQSAKSLFYKDEQFWVYFKLANGAIHKYRIVPGNAEDGIWIAPYLFRSDEIPTVEEIMFRSSNESIVADTIRLEWETIEFSSRDAVASFFPVKQEREESLSVESSNDFESTGDVFWNQYSPRSIAEEGYKSARSFLLQAGEFSCSFSYPLDSLEAKKLRITADCWVETDAVRHYNDISLVLSIERGEESKLWKSIPLYDQMIDPEQWNHILSFVEYERDTTSCVVKGYVWNNGQKPLLMDNFRFRVDPR